MGEYGPEAARAAQEQIPKEKVLDLQWVCEGGRNGGIWAGGHSHRHSQPQPNPPHGHSWNNNFLALGDAAWANFLAVSSQHHCKDAAFANLLTVSL